jgi:hypothetical protein
MTREEKIKDIKRRLSKELKHLRSVNDESALEITNILADLDNIEAECCETLHTNDIPIGAPCEITTYIDDRKQLVYCMGDGYFAVTRDEDEYYHGHLKADARPLTIWDIPNEFGGPPPWAIARAYNSSTTIWISDEIYFAAYESVGYTVERRPEEE